MHVLASTQLYKILRIQSYGRINLDKQITSSEMLITDITPIELTTTQIFQPNLDQFNKHGR